MAATLEASAGLTGPEVVARLESAIDDLAGRLEAGVRLSQVIMTPTWSDHDRGLPRDSNRRAGGTHRRSQSISSGHAAGAVAPQCSRPLYAYPRRDPRRTAPRALRRSESAAVRRGAVRDRRSRADSYPRHPAERGGDRPADLPAAGDRPYRAGPMRLLQELCTPPACEPILLPYSLYSPNARLVRIEEPYAVL